MRTLTLRKKTCQKVKKSLCLPCNLLSFAGDTSSTVFNTDKEHETYLLHSFDGGGGVKEYYRSLLGR